MIRFDLPAVTSGVYHLLRDGRVMYVGQSGNVLARITAWISSMPGSFDQAEVFPCAIHELSRVEEKHIRDFDPPLNVIGRTRTYHEIRVASVPWLLKRYGSALAYIRSRPEIVCGGELMQAGVLGPGATTHLLSLPDFPAPVELRRWRTQTRGKWRRDDVIAWWLKYRSDDAAQAA